MRALRAGDRVVVRYRLADADPDGPQLSDALGELTAVTADSVTVATRRGPVQIPRSAVVTAKTVPPAPPRRAPLR